MKCKMASRTEDDQPQMARDVLEIPVRQTRRNQEVQTQIQPQMQPQFLPLPPTTKSASTQTDLPWYPSTTTTTTMPSSRRSRRHERPSVPSVEELETWTPAQVVEYFDKRHSDVFKHNILQRLGQQGINGLALLKLTGKEGAFLSIGLPLGAAALLASLGEDAMEQSKSNRWGQLPVNGRKRVRMDKDYL